MSNICIIPARGGSKRIPRKNIIDFKGSPIISYSIKAALDSKLFDDVIVSTDDEEIKNIAIEYGASVPFLRSTQNSNDFSTTGDVVIEVLDNLNKKYDNFCCIYPCSVFTTPEILNLTYMNLKNSNLDSIIPIIRYNHPIQRALRINEGYLEYLKPENDRIRTQDLEPTYHDSGQFYWCKTGRFKIYKSFIMPHTTCYEINEKYVQDIDTMDDLEMAKLKYKLWKQK